jgi:hypothetical protein
MLTYDQVLLIASACHSLVNQPIFRRLHLTATEKSSLTTVHNSCINCALSMEAYVRSSNEEK